MLRPGVPWAAQTERCRTALEAPSPTGFGDLVSLPAASSDSRVACRQGALPGVNATTDQMSAGHGSFTV